MLARTEKWLGWPAGPMRGRGPCGAPPISWLDYEALAGARRTSEECEYEVACRVMLPLWANLSKQLTHHVVTIRREVLLHHTLLHPTTTPDYTRRLHHHHFLIARAFLSNFQVTVDVAIGLSSVAYYLSPNESIVGRSASPAPPTHSLPMLHYTTAARSSSPWANKYSVFFPLIVSQQGGPTMACSSLCKSVVRRCSMKHM